MKSRMKNDKPMASGQRKKIVIVTPVFNDWVAFGRVLEKLGALPELGQYELQVIAVDDCSSETPEDDDEWAKKGTITDVQIIRLACNLGHQRAIAVGLVAALEVEDMGAVVVMDSDGEDLPSDVPRLIAAWTEQPNSIIVAKRGLRKEGPMFRIFYLFYKMIFRLLTGQTINFGNFSLLPSRAVEALTHNSAIWNNLGAAVSRSRLPYVRLQLNRGKRLAGQSRMSFVSLALHGVSAISVYAEVVLVRMVAISGILAALALIGGVIVVGVKLGTNLAIPGWASYLVASLAVIFLQAVLLGAISVFQLLNARSLKPFIPVLDASIFILNTTPETK